MVHNLKTSYLFSILGWDQCQSLATKNSKKLALQFTVIKGMSVAIIMEAMAERNGFILKKCHIPILIYKK